MANARFVVAGLLATLSFPYAIPGAVASNEPLSDDADTALQKAAMMARLGNVIESKPLGETGLTAWVVEKNGQRLVFFSDSESKALIRGTVWDPVTGENLSDQIDPWGKSPARPPRPAAVERSADYGIYKPIAAFDGEFKGQIPESMKTVDSLAGFKEGNGGIEDTLYVIIDVRCPVCREAYHRTRPYVAKGRTIKWIPTAALGDKANGIPLAATVLQSGDPSVIHRMLGSHEKIKSEPSEQTIKALSENLEFLMAAFAQNSKDQAGVPAAFFIDRRTGKPRMVTGLASPVVLDDIFGKM